MRFASLTLELASPLHAGAGRAGMVARCHGFVPGHLLSYGLAAALGGHRGGQPEDYRSALADVTTRLRCGPLFLADPARDGAVLRPRRDRERVERHYLAGEHHVSLHHDVCSAADGALFEVESLSPRLLYGARRGHPTRLLGGLWFDGEDQLDGESLATWLGRVRLGGEQKMGLGQVRVVTWQPGTFHYPGIAQVDGNGLHLPADVLLPGPALNGVGQAPLQPWVGRLHDTSLGFGRRLGEARLVRMDGLCHQAATFLPSPSENGLGCWQTVAA